MSLFSWSCFSFVYVEFLLYLWRFHPGSLLQLLQLALGLLARPTGLALYILAPKHPGLDPRVVYKAGALSGTANEAQKG